MTTSQAEKIVRVYGQLLADVGPRQATLDAVARKCGLSRAGLLHHHSSRRALDAALLERLSALVEADLVEMAAAPEGPAQFYLASSFESSSALEQTVVAVSRLAQAGGTSAARALRDARDRWYALILEELGDPVLAKVVLLAGDGVSYQLDIEAGLQEGEGEFVTAADMKALADLLASLRR